MNTIYAIILRSIYLNNFKFKMWKKNIDKFKSLIGKFVDILVILLFISVIIGYIYYYNWPSTWWLFLIIASIVWLYMAMNIWANDVANNMWPAVWSKTITIFTAIVIAAIFEAAGAIIAWWDVVETIKWWIVNPDNTANLNNFIYMMLAALFGSALWINIATYTKSPVSATHSIVWWLVWAWVVAYGLDVVKWKSLAWIWFSWVLSPIMWWVVAALLLYSIRLTIFKKDNILKAAKKWVPIYVSLMVFSFTIYLIMKWLKQIMHISIINMLIISSVITIIVYFFSRYYIKKKYRNVLATKDLVNSMFWPPLVIAAALLSFAHWSNDVANAIWPLAAINDVIQNWELSSTASIPFWVIIIWALWLSLWLALFWTWLIKTVWSEITKLNQSRAYCVALSAAITVILASWLWLPVSSTHIAIWWVFWIWLIRERFKRANWENKVYVERNMIKTIVLSWIITLPVSAIISWIICFLLINFF